MLFHSAGYEPCTANLSQWLNRCLFSWEIDGLRFLLITRVDSSQPDLTFDHQSPTLCIRLTTPLFHSSALVHAIITNDKIIPTTKHTIWSDWRFPIYSHRFFWSCCSACLMLLLVLHKKWSSSKVCWKLWFLEKCSFMVWKSKIVGQIILQDCGSISITRL